ncbi:phospho-sugar mutase [Shewanella psychrotolerans]|uniref:phospho-sugar mutase n=1 Tax=Shewanella psychrotolerans TaxID=2864206 RepID=UPI001C65C3DC|nr:phospho-sugar mutase [Shewanella psychrotolerans]QYK02595.1 phospho-sugar mutase [Shewanella psychrotolerans]
MEVHLQAKIKHWLSLDADEKSRKQIHTLLDNGDSDELAKRFSGRLMFGTAGIRGVVGAGPMRMNRLVVQQTSKGVAEYLKAQIKDASTRGVIIGYDGRHDSKQFAHDTAAVLTSAGIKVYLTEKVAATPLVAFGVLHLHAAAGIVVTASHNPPQYNGYKVYWENGAQIIPPHDSGIAARIEHAATQPILLMSHNEAIASGQLIILGDDFYQAYRCAIKQAITLQNHTVPARVSLAYTAMHGVGADMAETVLKDAGFTQVYSVAAQREPDGDFPTVNFPNPEEAGAMDLVMAEAHKHSAMLACANDPDADRFAVAVRKLEAVADMAASEAYQMLTGDQVGVLLGHYLLSHAPDNQRLTCRTIVSSSLLSKISASMNGICETTLTGFKWLTNVGMAKQTRDNQFLFAYEEALGYTIGSMVWDKDGLSALVAFAQLTAELAANNQTIWDRLEIIYREHGFYLNQQVSIALTADSGAPTIGEQLRALAPSQIAGRAVVSVDDISVGTRYYADGREEVIDLPDSDVLIYQLDDGARVIVRPSGTEPKVKCYYEVVEQFVDTDSLQTVQARAAQSMAKLIKSHQQELPG